MSYVNGQKQCKCGESDITKFGRDVNKHDGLKTTCKKCHNAGNSKVRQNNLTEYRAVALAYSRTPNGKAKMRANKLRRKFWPELTNEQAVNRYNELLVAQGGCCALCNKHQLECKGTFHVDHDHETMQVRGLLCDFCNRVEVQDKTYDRVMKLMEYFKKHYHKP